MFLPKIAASLFAWLLLVSSHAEEERILPFFQPPKEFADQLGGYRSPLLFSDGSVVENADEWQKRRKQILDQWNACLGPWPPLIANPKVEKVETIRRENFIQHRITMESAPGQTLAGYLLVPDGRGPFPAVVVPFYDAETSIGLKGELRDFALQFARRGFVSLAIGSPGGNAWRPELGGAQCQPLAFLAYIAANCYNALAAMPEVDPARVGIAGHSYGGKWAMFASCLFEKFACAAWSDPGIVFDETRSNVNYWEPWYLGFEAGRKRAPGLITDQNPRTGAYAKLVEQGHDLHELHALMAPRPFLVSGGSEDFPGRWPVLNHAIAVNRLLGFSNRVAMTNRPAHNPTVESNEQLYSFFEFFLKGPR